MFLDSINPRLFSPLASPNARLYGIGLSALYRRLVENQLDGGECTPQEARQTIRMELLMASQSTTWAEEDLTEPADVPAEEKDDAGRIYRYLRACGWLEEMDDIGYRQITYFPQIAAGLLSALKSLSNFRSATIGSTCLGVYIALRNVVDMPQTNASQIEFAAKTSRTFFSDLSNIAGSAREIMKRMTEAKAGPAMFQVFFTDFLGGIILGDYTSLKTTNHPYRYRAETLSVVIQILRDDELLHAVVESLVRETKQPDRAIVREAVIRDLNDIFKVFENIDKIMERIEQYRSTMTRRTREAMQYSYRAIPDLGKKIDKAASVISTLNDSDDLLIPSPLLTETFISPGRLYTPRTPISPPEETIIQKKRVPIEEIAKNKAFDAYLHRRKMDPERLARYIESNLNGKSSVTTSEMVIDGLDGLIAFMQVRDLLHDALPSNDPCRKLLALYKVSEIPDSMTENDYLVAPNLLVERRSAMKKRTSNAT